MLSSEAKERVREAVDLVALVGEKVALRRAGRSWKGLCPFHAERTPSFTVNPDRQVWHCFGCGKGGDVFAWVTELEKVAFPEALQMLADRAGIELPKTARGPGDAARDRLYQANALANDFFRASLESPGGAEARDYLAGRGFEKPVLDAFQIGWAPTGWDGLVTTLGKLLPVAVLEEAGLALRRADGSRYDRFRNRITFPVMESAQRTAGFGARAIAPDDQPKYLNSPETAVYRKGSILFGLPQARTAIRESRQALIGEGYFDVMRLHAAGFRNAVATSGTALTFDQARILARLEAEAVLVYDGDDAGVRAADRALEPLMRAGLAVRVLLLPPGEDPDTFIRKEGAPAFQRLLDAATDAAAFLAGASLGTGGENPSKEQRVRRYVEVISRVQDPIRRRTLVTQGAQAFAFEEQVLLEALQVTMTQSIKGGAKIIAAKVAATDAARASAGISGGAEASESQEGSGRAPDRWEAELVARVLTEEGALEEMLVTEALSLLRSRQLKDLVEPWLRERRVPNKTELSDLICSSEFARAIIADLPDELVDFEESRSHARSLIERLKDKHLQAEIAQLKDAVDRAQKSADLESARKYMIRLNDLKQSRHPAVS